MLALRRAGRNQRGSDWASSAVPSLDDVFRGMLKVAAGLSDAHVRLDLNAYLTQMRELETLAGHNEAIYDTHPMFPLRVRERLLWFSMSEGYYHWTDSTKQAAPISARKSSTSRSRQTSMPSAVSDYRIFSRARCAA